jgi:Spy/CpxP family protein refolding chaperone
MKKRVAIAICFTIMAAAGLFTVARAGGQGGPPFGGRRGGPPPVEHFLAHMSEQLGLTEQQKTEVKTILTTEQTTVEPLIRQMDQNKQDLRAATKNGRFDEAQVRALATQQAQILTEMIVEKERSKAKIYNLLTEEQRTKADQMMERFEGPGPGFRRGRPADGQ